jgi:hypothetical protein
MSDLHIQPRRYTPTTGEVREQYWAASGDRRRGSEAWGEFDRWLADHDMEVRAQTLVQARQIAEVRAPEPDLMDRLKASLAPAVDAQDIAAETMGNWVKDIADDRTVVQIIVQAIEVDRAATRSVATYQQISDAEERLSAGVNESRWPCGCRYSFYELTHPDEGHVDGDHRPGGA